MTGTPARLLVGCLEREGVEYLFGIPGEENIGFVDALRGSSIRYVLARCCVRHCPATGSR